MNSNKHLDYPNLNPNDFNRNSHVFGDVCMRNILSCVFWIKSTLEMHMRDLAYILSPQELLKEFENFFYVLYRIIRGNSKVGNSSQNFLQISLLTLIFLI